MDRVMKAAIDKLISELNERFGRLNDLNERFGFLLNTEVRFITLLKDKDLKSS